MSTAPPSPARLSPAQVQRYFGEGHLVLEPVFDADEVAELRSILDTPAVTEAMSARGSGGQIFQLGEVDSRLLDLAFDARIADVVADLLGPNVQLQHSKLSFKSEGSAQLDWHQDLIWIPHSSPDLLSVAVYVDDVTAANGCMTMIAGSHLEGLRNHFDGDRFARSCQETEAFGDASRQRLVEVQTGGMSIHHTLILHGSLPNTTAAPRRLLIYGYRASHAVQLAGPVWSDTGRWVRGSYDGMIRSADMVFRLPPEPSRQRSAWSRGHQGPTDGG